LKTCYCVYIIKGKDGSFYTGFTSNIQLRLLKHNGLRLGGAKYTKTRRPWNLVFLEKGLSRSRACQREYEIKQMTRAGKEILVKSTSLLY